MLTLLGIAILVAVAMLAAIILLDLFVLRPKNARTAQRILDAENAAAERPRVILKDTTGDSSWNNPPC